MSALMCLTIEQDGSYHLGTNLPMGETVAELRRIADLLSTPPAGEGI